MTDIKTITQEKITHLILKYGNAKQFKVFAATNNNKDDDYLVKLFPTNTVEEIIQNT